MRIGVITDTHDHQEKIAAAVRHFNDAQVDRVLHAGDLIAPFTRREFAQLTVPMTAVFGNNDGERLGLKAQFGDIFVPPYELTLADRRIALLHEPDCLEAVHRGGVYDLVIYGHTHQIDVRWDARTRVLNPGESCCWLTGKAHIAIVDLIAMTYELIEI